MSCRVNENPVHTSYAGEICKRNITYGLLNKPEVKMAGYLPNSFFFFACLWTEPESRSTNSQKKKERGQYPAILTEKSLPIKNLLFGFRIKFFSQKVMFPCSHHRNLLVPSSLTLSRTAFTASLVRSMTGVVILTGRSVTKVNNFYKYFQIKNPYNKDK